MTLLVLLLGTAIVLVAIPIYFFPSVIAIARNHQKVVPIFWVNLACGWTLIGWVLVLVWSVYPERQPQGR